MISLLEFIDVSYGYSNGGKRVDILKDTCVTFEKSKLYTILGPSGSGKTTTLALAGALDVPQTGKVLYNGEDIRKIGLSKHRKKNVSLNSEESKVLRNKKHKRHQRYLCL